MRIIILACLLFLTNSVQAEIFNGQETDTCFKKSDNHWVAQACVAGEKEKSNTALQRLIEKSVREIKDHNDGPFNDDVSSTKTYGDVYSQHFIDAQKHWIQYRETLCLGVASEVNEDAYDYPIFKDQCVINLNRSHTKEIAEMNLSFSEKSESQK
ncbi:MULTISPECIES: lysozyme inhibitor LprI family protein [Enterobacterales]|uniref:lysozyme inhibitor LprI family protein n=1 Tax=Enterobacterales TaxID=91347 RepID=UPI002EDB1DDB